MISVKWAFSASSVENFSGDTLKTSTENFDLSASAFQDLKKLKLSLEKLGFFETFWILKKNHCPKIFLFTERYEVILPYLLCTFIHLNPKIKPFDYKKENKNHILHKAYKDF